EKVKQDLLESTNNPQFEIWNSTSIHMLYLVCLGFNGKECQELSLKLLKDYIEWSSEYFTKENMDILKENLFKINIINEDNINKSKEEIVHDILHGDTPLINLEPIEPFIFKRSFNYYSYVIFFVICSISYFFVKFYK